MNPKFPPLEDDPQFQKVLRQAYNDILTPGGSPVPFAHILTTYETISKAYNSPEPWRYLSLGGPGGKHHFHSEEALDYYAQMGRREYELLGMDVTPSIEAVIARYWEIYADEDFVKKLRPFGLNQDKEDGESE